ncbi:MAG: cation diffusion facilitator family transporter [Bacilli bacterium]|nr:cation diffusion facilitator family transporter [Bacilli bacterium]
MSTHSHDHSDVFHSHAPATKMKLAFILTLLILIVEVGGGFLSHSLALLSDAGHVITDLAAIGLTWYSLEQSHRPISETMTYGYHRSGILAALINSVTLIVISLIILVVAYRRFQTPEPAGGVWMFVSPLIGLILNLYMGLGMRNDNNINIKSAVLHMLGDAAASAAVIVGAITIYFTGWYIVDPILSVLISLLILFGAVGIVRQTVNILMEATPKGIEIQQVAEKIRTVQGVFDVHDLHVWSISSGKHALSCHIVLDGQLTIHDSQAVLREIEHQLNHLGIGHVTIQTEDADHPHENSVLCNPGEEHHHH